MEGYVCAARRPEQCQRRPRQGGADLERHRPLPHFNLIEQRGLKFSRWLHQAPYLPQCGGLAATPHAARLARLPVLEQYAAVELFRGNMLRHNLIVVRNSRLAGNGLPGFEGDGWQAYVPIRLPDTILVQKRLPAGAAAVLINQAHGEPDLFLPVNTDELQLFEAVDGVRTIRELIQQTARSGSGTLHRLNEKGRQLFERLYWFDQVVFDTALANKNSRLPVDPGLGQE